MRVNRKDYAESGKEDKTCARITPIRRILRYAREEETADHKTDLASRCMNIGSSDRQQKVFGLFEVQPVFSPSNELSIFSQVSVKRNLV